MTKPCRDRLDQVEPEDLTQIALQMLFTIERMELIIPEITDTIRKALEQGRPTPQPVAEGPADGEVAAALIELRSTVMGLDQMKMYVAAQRVKRAAELLQRQHPQPVAVSERLPGPEDCTAQGWCWVFYRGFATWTLEPPLGQDGKHTGYTHWLPANALPTPEAQ